jgi:hypothetical protein
VISYEPQPGTGVLTPVQVLVHVTVPSTGTLVVPTGLGLPGATYGPATQLSPESVYPEGQVVFHVALNTYWQESVGLFPTGGGNVSQAPSAIEAFIVTKQPIATAIINIFFI